MSRPATLKVGNTSYWTIMIYTDAGVLVDADSTPTVVVYKNGSVTADVVTVTKRSATTGIYDAYYNPASEAEGDCFTIQETATISSQAYVQSWNFEVLAAERGTDNASTFDASSDAVTTDAASRTASQANVSAVAGASEVAAIDAVVDAIKAVTDNLPNSGALTDLASSADLANVDSVADSVLVIANKLDSAMEADGLVSRFTTNALEQAPSSSGGGDATASNQSAIITHLTDIKGSGFASTDTLEAIRDRGDAAWTTGGTGGGIYSLAVTCEDTSGNAVPNVRVNIGGTALTLVSDSNGLATFNLDAGSYTLVTSPPDAYSTPSNIDVTLSANASETITLAASTSGSAGWVG